ncbi:MAG: hypothetical protein A2043_07670 [Candidatus Schekmanbacteria bacterium GWA2_38_9]|uniref:Uncharacterized protein n=1 Tax=Candidatus Schekmanbacteria bacterium RIFCSPLOWO2_12_FULL_38_15 TaxID=1817883 RepID=A0A1F7SGE5_9BACT|nr:MAG: hypothetical protein A2043_07670 [Candidatus Schekmanbacteria bacterium GWA2_38_9]OGL52860.1 MAG: hypothetical protein A3G31_00485 [Candidatus Schekmanbacteria bacterium RIFCSPLOWO2_12_FULL_38_15]
MIKNHKKLQEFERKLLKKEKVDIMQNFRIVEALYKEAVALGIFPLKNPLEGLEIDIKIAKVVNSVSKISK